MENENKTLTIVEEGEIVDLPSLSEVSTPTQSKKRHYDEIMQSEKLVFFTVQDFDSRTCEEKSRHFYSVKDLNAFMAHGKEHNFKAHKSNEFVTKRFMFRRIDSIRNDVKSETKQKILKLERENDELYYKAKSTANLCEKYEEEIRRLKSEATAQTEKNFQLMIDYQKLQAQYNELFVLNATIKPVVDQIMQNSLSLGYKFQ